MAGLSKKVSYRQMPRQLPDAEEMKLSYLSLLDTAKLKADQQNSGPANRPSEYM